VGASYEPSKALTSLSMSYEPLHHKYRPKSFAELVGQEAIATTLTNAIRAAKIAPAYLFTGPRGTGKTSSARILAKSLNCLNTDKPTPQPCGVCDVCQGITKGYSLDVIEIDAASNTGVDNIREIIERAQFAPVQCRYKVYVIDECHMLSSAAFNALLKTLEEPPKHVVFILATTDPQRVLPTIISRCQRFDFRRIDLEAMAKHLSYIAYQENINITIEAITLIAQIAQGGLRDAESLLDQVSLLSGDVTPERVWDLVGSVSEHDLLFLLNAIAKDNPEAVLDCTRQVLDRGREPLIILQNLAAFYRDLLIAKTASRRNDLVACTPQTWQALIDFAQQFDISTILLGQQHLRTAEVQLKNTTQPRLWLEVTLLGLLPSAHISVPQNDRGAIYPPRISSPTVSPSLGKSEQNSITSREPPSVSAPENNSKTVEEVKIDQTYTFSKTPTTPSSPEETPSSLHPPEPHPEIEVPTSASQTEDVSQSTEIDLTQVWQRVLSNLQPISKQALLRQMCHLIEFDGTVARVGVKEKWYKQVQTYHPIIVAAFKETFKCEVEINLEIATSSTSVSPEASPQKKPITRPSYEPPSAPSPEVPKSTKPPTTKSSNAANTAAIQSSDATRRSDKLSPTQPSASTPDWEVDEVEAAAQRLAQFFDGEIIRLTDDIERPTSTTPSEWEGEVESDDEF
jgi:DNA polymerase III subunit gamma/tau